MNEVGWLTSQEPLVMLSEYPTTWDVRNSRLYWCACLRHQWDALTDDYVRQLVEAAETHADADAAWFTGAFPYEFEVYQRANRGVGKHRYYWALRGFFETPPESLIRFTDILSRSQARGKLLKVGRDPWSAECAALLSEAEAVENTWLCNLIREVFGNPFRPVAVNPAWRTSDVLALAQQMYDSRDFGAMPILADALQDAGCDNVNVLDHCRDPGEHVRGCWVIDLLLGK